MGEQDQRETAVTYLKIFICAYPPIIEREVGLFAAELSLAFCKQLCGLSFRIILSRIVEADREPAVSFFLTKRFLTGKVRDVDALRAGHENVIPPASAYIPRAVSSRNYTSM